MKAIIHVFWTGFLSALVVIFGLQWWLFTHSPICAGEAGNRERIMTYGITKHSAIGLVGIVAASSVAGIPLVWLAAAIGHDPQHHAPVATLMVVAINVFASTPGWLIIRWENLRGRNPVGIT